MGASLKNLAGKESQKNSLARFERGRLVKPGAREQVEFIRTGPGLDDWM